MIRKLRSSLIHHCDVYSREIYVPYSANKQSQVDQEILFNALFSITNNVYNSSRGQNRQTDIKDDHYMRKFYICSYFKIN